MGLSFLALPKEEWAWGRMNSTHAQLLAEAEANWEEAQVVMPTYWATSDRHSLYTRMPLIASRATLAAAKSEVEGLNKLLGAVLDGARVISFVRTSGVCIFCGWVLMDERGVYVVTRIIYTHVSYHASPPPKPQHPHHPPRRPLGCPSALCRGRRQRVPATMGA